ncbi:DEAD/DEAH box helicase [Arcobacter porcinus]|uniref:Type IV methyl-directed restriction endonuclease n=1 Tax=Arcobacter porcinus TaxID=1935204 RepID=A0A5C2HC34_9BACT|nr:DEAD/DEAH box helicase family protein [Arcobacter porcinus]OCL89411.1 type I restriction enzyme EcoKI subunit R [Aliarcobacter thereius]QEP40447.1 type IV methyl-directed restriction endonuclease [Arcobacter porcinus]
MIELLKLEIDCYKKTGCKNIVQQLLAPTMKINVDNVTVHNGYTIVLSGEDKYCLLRNEVNAPKEYQYILKVDKKATAENISNGDIRFIKWIKHPLLANHTTEGVIKSWDKQFNFVEEDLEQDIKGLREPQIAALYSILSHFKVSKKMGIVVMPTGTGKTETMLSVLIANKCKKILITVPSDALRTQIFNKFYTLGLLKEFGIINSSALNPKVGILNENFSSLAELEEFIKNCNITVTTMNLLSSYDKDKLETIAKEYEYLFIDEAHHSQASSWSRIRDFFKEKTILQFTATPFRNDGKRLEGDIIFNFPLKKAQEQGYFKSISFSPIREYELEKGDILIAEKAVQQLRDDFSQGYEHILMARCENKKRAEEVFKLYEKYTDLNPVLIHSSIPNKKETMDSIVNSKHKIIVAVDMLGEGFDLPQLKIAAFHDIRKSLPVTLQFAGRFTRTSFDKKLGNATFIANLADVKVKEELDSLYAMDSDWNLLLSELSTGKTEEKIELDEFLKGFSNIDEATIPFQNINMAMSTVVYKNNSSSFNLKKYKSGLKGYDKFQYKFEYINESKNTLVFIYADKKNMDWVNYHDIYEFQWNLMVLYYDDSNKLLYIHSSDKSSLYKEVANYILNNEAIILNELNVFKIFHNILRVSLQNVGLKEWMNKHIRFRMLTGSDIEEAISKTAQTKSQKAFVFGSGYDDGNKISLGCSYKGRIWSYARGSLNDYVKWCDVIGSKMIDPNIDPNQILKDTLIPKYMDCIPNKHAVSIDWDESYYEYSDNKKNVEIDGSKINVIDLSLSIDTLQKGKIVFSLTTPDKEISFEQTIAKKVDATTGETYGKFNFSKISSENIDIQIGNKKCSLVEYFKDNPPMIWFADGSSLQGIKYVELKQLIQAYPAEKLIDWNWNGVDIGKESQGVNPLIIDSIQYVTIKRLKTFDFDIIYDDDGSGEIADIVTIKEKDDVILIQFYHLKFAHGDSVGQRVSDFYEVCGQAQKSIIWKHKSGVEFFERLLRREIKSKNGNERSRIEKGSKEDLERLLKIAKNIKPMKFEIFIVQPGLSKQNTNDTIQTLIGVTESYLKEVGGVDLGVIVNE